MRDHSSPIDALAQRLHSLEPRRDVALAPYTTFRIGGPADLFCEPASADDLALAVSAARELHVPYFVLGLGANILIGDKGFRGLVIRNVARHERWSEDGTLWVESGAVMRDLISESVHRGWSGLEHFVGIPSTVGGAIWQNLHFLSPAPERERTVFIAEVFDLGTECFGRLVPHPAIKQRAFDAQFAHPAPTAPQRSTHASSED